MSTYKSNHNNCVPFHFVWPACLISFCITDWIQTAMTLNDWPHPSDHRLSVVMKSLSRTTIDREWKKCQVQPLSAHSSLAYDHISAVPQTNSTVAASLTRFLRLNRSGSLVQRLIVAAFSTQWRPLLLLLTHSNKYAVQSPRSRSYRIMFTIYTCESWWLGFTREYAKPTSVIGEFTALSKKQSKTRINTWENHWQPLLPFAWNST